MNPKYSPLTPQQVCVYWNGYKDGQHQMVMPLGAIPFLHVPDQWEFIALDARSWLTVRKVKNRAHPDVQDLQTKIFQPTVLSCLMHNKGFTSTVLAEKLELSARTVEGWRSGRILLPIRTAYNVWSALYT